MGQERLRSICGSFWKACDGGVAVGCGNLSIMYEKGRGVKQNDGEAINYYGKACDLKEQRGCDNYVALKANRR